MKKIIQELLIVMLVDVLIIPMHRILMIPIQQKETDNQVSVDITSTKVNLLAGATKQIAKDLNDSSAILKDSATDIVGASDAEDTFIPEEEYTVDIEPVVVTEPIVEKPTYIVEDTNETLYCKANTGINIRQEPNTDSDVIGYYLYADDVSVTGRVKNSDWIRIDLNGMVGFVHSDYLTTDKIEVPKATTTKSNTKQAVKKTNTTYTGEVLNAYNGRIQGPWCEETWYNLPMDGIVAMMHRRGYEGDYWVREDGVKCLGDKIMCAANLKVYPRGSIVQTSLGTGIVCDTGGFAKRNPYQFDIATAW